MGELFSVMKGNYKSSIGKLCLCICSLLLIESGTYIYINTPFEFNLSYIGYSLLLMSCFTFIGVIFLKAFQSFFMPYCVLTSTFFLYAYKFSFLSFFQNMTIYAYSASFILTLPLIYCLYRLYGVFDEKGRRFALFCLMVVFILPIALHPFNRAPSSAINSDKKYVFDSKPNIYMLSFDSLAPKEKFSKYLNLTSLKYQHILDENYYTYNNSLSFFVPTAASLATIMNLGRDPSNYEGKGRRFFSGQDESPLSSIFKNNGYKFYTGFPSYALGSPGEYIDGYIESSKSELVLHSKLCLAPGRSLAARMRGGFFCPVYGRMYAYGYNALNLFVDESFSNKDAWIDRVYNHIDFAATSKNPIATFIHTYTPIGHTSLGYDHNNEVDREEYRNYVIKNLVLLEENLSQITSKINEIDPGSILMIFGDHGMYLSGEADKYANPKFYYGDRHEVLISILQNKNYCANKEAASEPKDHNTVASVLISLFSCLSREPVSESNMYEDDTLLNIIFSNS